MEAPFPPSLSLNVSNLIPETLNSVGLLSPILLPCVNYGSTFNNFKYFLEFRYIFFKQFLKFLDHLFFEGLVLEGGFEAVFWTDSSGCKFELGWLWLAAGGLEVDCKL